MRILDYVVDPLFRGPTLGSVLMCIAASLVGGIVVLRKRSLLGETLAHAAYPGVLLALTVASQFFSNPLDEGVLPLVLLGASIAAWLALNLIRALEKRRVRPDSALCFVLASFFGFGLLFASRLQVVLPKWYQQAESFLFGQTVTMTDQDIWLYGGLVLTVLSLVILFFKELQVVSFDAEFAQTLGVRAQWADRLFTLLLVAAVVIGLRSVGVVLMSAMLIIPAITARQFCHRLPVLLTIAALVGGASGFLGTILSVEGGEWLSEQLQRSMALATGPSIVLTAALFCVLALLLAPERGLVIKTLRMARFRMKCLDENLLKAIWRARGAMIGPETLAEWVGSAQTWVRWRLWRLIRQGWVVHRDASWHLTEDGHARATQIVRLHRLWELYLTDYLGLGVERVHRNAEEIEHILTPDIERQLVDLLNQPAFDPHKQPIPPGRAT
ncbi:MAG: iron chelate uptake ABC transporter family permease subunit [Chlamydiia bacterium]